jgi:hypothetical protein
MVHIKTFSVLSSITLGYWQTRELQEQPALVVIKPTCIFTFAFSVPQNQPPTAQNQKSHKYSLHGELSKTLYISPDLIDQPLKSTLFLCGYVFKVLRVLWQSQIEKYLSQQN